MNGNMIAFLSIWLLLVGLLAAGQSRPAPAATPNSPPHHTPGGGYRNIHIEGNGRFWDFWRWRLGLGPKEEESLPSGEVPPYHPPTAAPDLNSLHHPDLRKIQVTWIGHSTFLVQVAGLNILTDPIFSQRASPLSFAGPKRRAAPGVRLEQLPPIHAALISHNHYDHLDLPTVAEMGNRVRFFVPLGLADWFSKNGLTQVEELDWWQTASLGNIRLHCVPAQHFSMRTLFDRDRTLWGGWVMETPVGNIYFTGDTGYCPHFQEIGRRLGPMRLALIHVGGYGPRWFMRPMHANPEEAVRIHQEVRSRQSIGMHWGTFKLTDEPLGEPPRLLQEALTRLGIPADRFVVLKIGETRIYDGEQ